MAEASDIEIQKDAEANDKGAEGVQTLSQEELKQKAARVKQMEHLRMKIKTLKGKITKIMNKLETVISAFEKVETEQAPTTKVRRKAKEIM